MTLSVRLGSGSLMPGARDPLLLGLTLLFLVTLEEGCYSDTMTCTRG